ncbi:hypothetical protein [Halomonas litopenaei]|uniref:hypothetical protein n=1 Tax=Halomonas litopenaei TaxID=2109328 RepID=UPI003FA02790
MATIALLVAGATPSPVGAVLTAALCSRLIHAHRHPLQGQLRCLVENEPVATSGAPLGAVDDEQVEDTGLSVWQRRHRRLLRALCQALVRWWGKPRPPVPGRWQWGPLAPAADISGRLCPDADWREIELTCESVGARLIALRWQGHTHWLWPDSMTPEEHRVLRRYLLGMPVALDGHTSKRQ